MQFSGLLWPPCEPECRPLLDHLSRFHTSHYTGHNHMRMKYTYFKTAVFAHVYQLPLRHILQRTLKTKGGQGGGPRRAVRPPFDT